MIILLETSADEKHPNEPVTELQTVRHLEDGNVLFQMYCSNPNQI